MSHAPPPELELILCCLSARPDWNEGRIRELLSQALDWTLLVERALAHAATPFLHRSFSEMPPQRVPDELLEALRVHVRENRQRNDAVVAELVALSPALEEQGLSAISCAGPVLATIAYGDPLLPSSERLDLLVPRESFGRACGLLEALGYCGSEGEGSHDPAARDRGAAAAGAVLGNSEGASLSVRAAVGGVILDPTVSADMWARAQRVPLVDASVPAFAAEDWLVILSLRASEERGSHLGSISDVAALLNAYPELDPLASLARARGWGCEPTVRLALTLAKRLLAAPLLDAAARVLASDGATQRAAAQWEEGLLAPSPQTAGTKDAEPPQARGAPRDLRAAARAAWSERSPLWRRAASSRAPWEAKLDRALLEAAGVQPGQTVLDLASGAGNPAVDIACLLGDLGIVVATDLVPEMLVGAARRATEEALPALRCCAAQMEALPFGDDTFDALVCRLGIMFSPRVDRALAEARRVLKPGARASFLVWGPLERNTMFRVLYESVARFFRVRLRSAGSALAPPSQRVARSGSTSSSGHSEAA
jgi:hypothetical protein